MTAETAADAAAAGLYADADTVPALLGQLAGSASMCWSDIDRAGVFDDAQAVRFVDAAVARLNQLRPGSMAEDRRQATILALEVDLAAARGINENQQATILSLSAQLRAERSGRGGWGDRDKGLPPNLKLRP